MIRFGLLLCSFFIISCVNSGEIPKSANVKETSKSVTSASDALVKLSQSEQQWQRLNKTGNYSYHRLVFSFSGYSENTKITVKNNKVVARTFAWSTGVKRYGEPDKGWAETSATLGSHKKGAAIKTMEMLYQECRQVLSKKSESKITLQLDKRGLLKTCTSRHPMCMDDCGQGVEISNLIL